MPDNRDELDRLLDSALGTYADPGSDAGLESRILSRLATDAAPASRRRWLWWTVALPLAASLLFFAVLTGTREVHSPSPSAQQAHITPQPTAPSSEAGNSSPTRPSPIRDTETELRKPRRHRLSPEARAAPLPKLDIFPTPQPLSPQEEALVNFASHATQPERESLLAAQRQADAPIKISAIEVKPLELPSSGAH